MKNFQQTNILKNCYIKSVLICFVTKGVNVGGEMSLYLYLLKASQVISFAVKLQSTL